MPTDEPDALSADTPWYDPAVTGRKDEDGKIDNRELQLRLDAAVTAIDQSEHERNRIQLIISDMERVTGQPINDHACPDLSAYSDLIFSKDFLKYNVCYSVVSTLTSRICSFRPRSQFIPEGGKMFQTQRQCRKATSASDAWAQRERYQEVASHAFGDGMAGPGGVLKVYTEDHFGENGKKAGASIRLMRLPPWELKISEEDDKYGDPECMYHERWMSLEAALRLYGKNNETREAIKKGQQRLGGVQGYGSFATRRGHAMVRVVDAYKRGPSGRHVIMVGDLIVKNAAYEHVEHIFERIIFDNRMTGGWGISAVAPIRSIQERIDDHLGSTAEAFHMAPKMVVGVTEGTTAPEEITNEPVLMIRTPPGGSVTFSPVQQVSPATWNWWSILKAMAFEILGVSPNAAQATKPAGVTAAVAIEAVTDLQNDRLSQLSQRWEQLVCRITEKWYALSCDAGAGGDEYVSIDRGSSRVVKFESVGKNPSIRVFPTSLFGRSIPAALQRGMEAVKAGWFSEEEIMYILDVPDLGPATEIKLAEFFYIEKLVDDVLFDAKYETPSPYVDPAKVFEYARRRCLIAETDGSFPAENMVEMRKLVDYAYGKSEEAKNKGKGAPMANPLLSALPAAGGVPGPAQIAAPPLPGLGVTPEASPLAMPQTPLQAA